MKKNRFALICLLLSLFSTSYLASFPSAQSDIVPHGAISIVFDDNYDSQFDYAWPLLQERGINGTFYIRTDKINEIGFMTASELQTLQLAGNEMGSHSITHTSFTSLSEQQIIAECLDSKKTLEQLELTVTNFAYPNGHTNATIDSIVDDYFETGRTAYVEPYLITVPTNQFRLPGYSAEDEDNELQTLTNMVDQIYSTNSWAIILFHHIKPNDTTNPYTTSQEDFEIFLDYIITKGVPTVTVKQGWDLTSIPQIASLAITTTHGTTTPISGGYAMGTTLMIEAVAPVVGVGERFVWEGWSGSGVGSYTGLDNPATIVMNQSITELVSWNHQFSILINQNGVDLDFSGNVVTIDGVGYPNEVSFWVDGGSHSYSFVQELSVNQGKKYVWYSSSGLTVQQSGSIVISDSGSFIANYKIQYYVDVISSHGNVDGAGWYDLGAYVYAEIDQPIIEELEDVRYVFSGWIGDGSGTGTASDLIVVNSSVSIMASWQKQYLFVFNQEGISADYEPFLTVDSINQYMPFSVWIDEGTVVEFVYPDKIPAGFGTEYVLILPLNQSTLSSDSPTIMTAIYNLQTNMNLPIMIAIIAIIGSLVFAILFMRRKSMI